MQPIEYFWRAARRWPTNVAIDAPTGRLVYADLAQRVRALAVALTALDPTVQSRVAICAHNGTAHIVALLAVLASGKIWVPMNTRSQPAELNRIIEVTEPSIVITDEPFAGILELRGAALLLTDESMTADAPSVGQAIRSHAQADTPRADVSRDAVQAIKFTGGTTGLPKGVMQPYRAWVANIISQQLAWCFRPDDRYVVAAPISHGTSTYLLPVLAQGGCLVIPERAGADGVIQAFRQGGTVSFMPPTLVYMLMSRADVSRSDFPSLRCLIYGAAPMPTEKVAQVREFFGPVLGTTYGQTEAPQILTAMMPEDFESREYWGSVGRPTWSTEMQIVAPDGQILGPGEVGEVVVRGDLVMTGYWRNPDKTGETLRDGWLHTGDRGLIDERGYLFLKDRLKDMVITGGFNVYPIDVEGALVRHHAVHECTVFGVPDDKWGEAVQAAVQLKPGQSATEQELIAFVRELLGPVQTPKRIHFYEDLPKSPVGKVLKNEVRKDVVARRDAGADRHPPA